MDEASVVAAFITYLTADSWTRIQASTRGADVTAVRNGETLIAEAKGHTSDPGTDMDIAYGQLLRRMTQSDAPARPGAPGTRYALVIPTSLLATAHRVPTWVRARLGIEVYTVADTGPEEGTVTRVD